MSVRPVTASITLTRRSLLRNGAAAAAATLVGLRPWAVAPAAASAGHLLRSSYSGLIGRRFTAGSVELRLVSVGDVAGASVDRSLAGSEDAFVLTFVGPLEPVVEAGTHTVRNPALGTFELFMSLVGRPLKDCRYEAVIDRSVGAVTTRARRVARS